MKSIFAWDGAIGNFGNIQPDMFSLPDFAGPDPGIVPVAVRHAPGGSTIVDEADQSAIETTSAAGIASDASGEATSGLLISGPIFSNAVSYAPLVITPVFGSSITTLPGTGADPTTSAEVEGAIEAAINYYDTNWTSSVPVGTVINSTTINTVNITIQFDYGTLNGVAMNSHSGASESHYGLTTIGNGTYRVLDSTLAGVLPDLPSTDPTNGGIFLVTNAQSQLLGTDIPGSGPAGYVGLNSIPNGVTMDYNLANQSVAGEVGAVGAIEHEISEVFGRSSDLGSVSPNTYTLFDLYRFSGPDTPALTAGASDYFSLNNGTTAAGYFNNHPLNGGDAGDWASSGTHDVPADAFDAFLTTGTAGTISNLDSIVLGSIGLRQVNVTARTLVWTGAQSPNFATAANWIDITDGLDPALTSPAAVDTAQFLSGGGTIAGSGTVAALQFGGTSLWNVASAASLSAASSVTVGQSGSGTLLVSGGASIAGLGGPDTITGAAGAAASVTVDGTGSAWRSAGELIVGDLGSGNLTIADKASVTAVATASVPALILGEGNGGVGTLTVTGPGSRATLVGQVDVGQAGTGLVTVENQGTVTTGGSALNPTKGIDIAQQAGGAGSIAVFGGQALLSNTGEFVVGDAGVGSLTIEAGGTVVTTPGTVAGLAGLVVGNSPGAAGSSVNVSGAGSDLAVTGLLDVGVNGSGGLHISGGATVTAGSLDSGNAAAAVGQISVSGTGSSLNVAGPATVADDGTGVLSVLDGATFSGTNLTIGSLADSSGALIVSGTGSAVNLTGALNIGTALGTGDLTLGPGGAIHAGVINQFGQVVDEGGLLDPTVLLDEGTDGGTGTIASDFIIDEGTIAANSKKAANGVEVVAGTVVGGGTLTISGGTTLDGTTQNSPGLLLLDNIGTLEVQGPVLNAPDTTFTDNGTPSGSVTVIGTYDVVNSVVDVQFLKANEVLVLDDISGFNGTVTTTFGGDKFVITGGTLSNLGVSNGDTLTMSDSGQLGGTDRIMFAGPVSAAGFNVVNGNTLQVVACFAAGTRIATAHALVAVEDLCVGDRLVTSDGGCEPIVWIGQRAVNCARHPWPETVWPVRVSAGAFGKNVPVRELYLSPDHAVFVNNVLVPVKLLVNGSSIVQVKRATIAYFHVELPRHAIILAEGLQLESYLDIGGRADFTQNGKTIRLFPDLGVRFARDVARVWEIRGAAPLVVRGPKLEAARLAVMADTSATGSSAHTNRR